MSSLTNCLSGNGAINIQSNKNMGTLGKSWTDYANLWKNTTFTKGKLWITNTATFICPYRNWLHLSCRHSRSLHHRWKGEAHRGQCHTESVRADIWIRLLKGNQKVYLRLYDLKVQIQSLCLSRKLCELRWKQVSLNAKQQKVKKKKDSKHRTMIPHSSSSIKIPIKSSASQKKGGHFWYCTILKGTTWHSRQSAGSSDPSPQSSTVSHFHQKGIHSSVPQRNY